MIISRYFFFFNPVIFVIETVNVFYELGTEFLCIMYMNIKLQRFKLSRHMIQKINVIRFLPSFLSKTVFMLYGLCIIL